MVLRVRAEFHVFSVRSRRSELSSRQLCLPMRRGDVLRVEALEGWEKDQGPRLLPHVVRVAAGRRRRGDGAPRRRRRGSGVTGATREDLKQSVLSTQNGCLGHFLRRPQVPGPAGLCLTGWRTVLAFFFLISHTGQLVGRLLLVLHCISGASARSHSLWDDDRARADVLRFSRCAQA